MILLDPELEPGRAPASAAAKQIAASAPSQPQKNFRLPSTRSLSRFLAEAQAAVRLRGQVTVLLTTDSTICDLNLRFRGKSKPTDVLSFPSAQNLLQNAKPAERVAGDIAISVETARRQSVEQGHSLTTEINVLILHGLLHLAGYDHEADAGRMRRRERLLRSRLGLPSGLIERSGEQAIPKARHAASARPAAARLIKRSQPKSAKKRSRAQ